MDLTFGTWCSGIEAASEAWLPLGWGCRYVAEIEPFPCAYLSQRHGATRPQFMPDPAEIGLKPEDARSRAAAIRALKKIRWNNRLPNFGDITQISAQDFPQVDVLGAGFPCQDFSIAGLRASLGGARGNLSTIGVRLLLEAADLGLVRCAVLEQVPDVLNTEDNAWGNILGALVGADAALKGLDHGGRWPRAGMVAGPRARVAWRILDAQHFRLAQRRERVWAVVDFGNGPDPVAVLFERNGVLGHSPARAQARQRVAPTLAARSRGGGGLGTDFDLDGGLVADGAQRRTAAFGGNNTSGPIDVATARTASHTASGRQDFETETFVTETSAVIAPSLRAQAQAQASHRDDSDVYVAEIAGTLQANGKAAGSATSQDAENGLLVAHSLRGEGFDASEDGTGRGTPIVPVAYSIMPQNSGKDYKAREVDVAQPVMAAGPAGGNQGGDYIVQEHCAFDARQSDVLVYGDQIGPIDTGIPPAAIAFSLRGREGGAMPEIESGDVAPALRAAEGGSTRPFVANTMAVRRITVVEAEILQGFPPNATLIDWPSANRKDEDLAEAIAYLIGHGFSPKDALRLAQTPDGPRYKAIGNSWPVNVARWIGERIQQHMPPRSA